MQKVSYRLEDMQTMSRLLNDTALRGLTLEQARNVTAIAAIIDSHMGIEEVPDAAEKEEDDGVQ